MQPSIDAPGWDTIASPLPKIAIPVTGSNGHPKKVYVNGFTICFGDKSMTITITWNPIATAPTNRPVLVAGQPSKEFHTPMDIAVLIDGHWVHTEAGGGVFSLDDEARPHWNSLLYTPTHWAELPSNPNEQ